VPLYDLICHNPACGHRERDYFKHLHDPLPQCPKCHEPMQVDWQGNAPAVHDFKKYAGLWNDITHEPIEIRSRGQLKEVCKRHNLTSKLLEW